MVLWKGTIHGLRRELSAVTVETAAHGPRLSTEEEAELLRKLVGVTL